MQLESKLLEWIEDQRSMGLGASRLAIRLKAKALCRDGVPSTPTFSASQGWCTRFLKRNNLSLRQKTKIVQKLPNEYEEKIVSFQKCIIKQ